MKIQPAFFVPLLAVLSVQCKTTARETSEGKFGGGEHLMIGDEGYRQALGKAKGDPLDKIPRADGDVEFTYGEIVALSGDFYPSASELDNDRKKQGWFDSINPLSDYNNVRAVIVAFREESVEAEKQKTNPDANIGDRNLKYLQSFGMDYLELAVCNTDHFGWHSMKRYVREHGEAISLAQKAHALRTAREQRGDRDDKPEKELYRQAVLRNGFADHFLTDGFAAGHVRVPRAQGIKARKVNCEPKAAGSDAAAGTKAQAETNNARLTGALAKIQHDNDHTYETHGGLKVRNAAGNAWKARSDGELYKAALADDSAVRYAAEAVRRSVAELQNAWETGEAPVGLYTATELVPFIDPTEETMVETFSPKLSDAALQKFIVDPEGTLFDRTINKAQSFIVKLTPAIVRTYFSEMPALMEEFRRDVAKDVDNDPELTRRIAPGYINGYLNVQ